jgi:hypothetical protein
MHRQGSGGAQGACRLAKAGKRTLGRAPSTPQRSSRSTDGKQNARKPCDAPEAKPVKNGCEYNNFGNAHPPPA